MLRDNGGNETGREAGKREWESSNRYTWPRSQSSPREHRNRNDADAGEGDVQLYLATGRVGEDVWVSVYEMIRGWSRISAAWRGELVS
jgi:hypothetical protein